MAPIPYAGLIEDPAGNLFGTTGLGGAYGGGTVFELTKTASGYASTPTVLANFDGTNGGGPVASLIADAAGNLFSTASLLGAYNWGTVFEIANTGTGYASTATPLVSFNFSDGGQPVGKLVEDVAGNLFGTTYQGGLYNAGTVFEIAKTNSGYASTPTILFNFDGTNGAAPAAGLIVDDAGDLLGTTAGGGAYGYGTVFEIAKTPSGYASTPTILVNFDFTHGYSPLGDLITDAAGNLFSTTQRGGTYDQGIVFEIAKTASGYASTPTVLANFDGTHGAFPDAGLIADALGNLFGTTQEGGAYGLGTVFEIAKTTSGYASTPTVLANFDGTNGYFPFSGLIADAAGNLFGTTVSGNGTVFEITNSGFVVAPKMLDAVYGAATNITTLSGMAEANSSVSIFDSAKLIGKVTAAADGTWNLQANVTGNVVHSYTEISTDGSGNTISSTGVTLFAQAAKQSLQGGNGNDVLIGGPNDTLMGGEGSDTFVFNPSFGKDTVADFNVSKDVIAFDHVLFSNATTAQVLSQTHDSKAGAVIVVDASDTVTLVGVTLAQLQAHQGDFHFF